MCMCVYVHVCVCVCMCGTSLPLNTGELSTYNRPQCYNINNLTDGGRWEMEGWEGGSRGRDNKLYEVVSHHRNSRYIHTHAHAHTHMHTHTHTHTHTYTHTYTHTHTHTHTSALHNATSPSIIILWAVGPLDPVRMLNSNGSTSSPCCSGLNGGGGAKGVGDYAAPKLATPPLTSGNRYP